MYDFVVGATLTETAQFKKANVLYSRFREVSPRSITRLRGIDGVDGWIILPGFEALPYWQQEPLLFTLHEVFDRQRRGPIVPVELPAWLPA